MHKARTLARRIIGRGSGLVGVGGPSQSVGVDHRVGLMLLLVVKRR